MSPQTQTGTIVDVGCNPPIITAGALSCLDTSTILSVTGGTPPYTWAATGGQIQGSGASVTLAIGASVTQTHLGCALQTYQYSAHVDSIAPDSGCVDQFRALCVSIFFNCYDEWTGWTHDFGLGCGDPSFDSLLGTIDCPSCPSVTPPCAFPSPGSVCSENRIMSSLLAPFSHTYVCGGDGLTYIDVTLPILDDNPSTGLPDCTNYPSLEGQLFTNYADTESFGSGVGPIPPSSYFYGSDPNLVNPAYAAGQLFLTPNLGTFEEISTPSGDCWPCVLLQGTDIVVTVTDSLGVQATAVVHVS